MKLSVIIVNYNVEFFLEQCLNSCIKALQGIDGEIFVVDNNSIDRSVAMVQEKFPQVELIASKKNLGFSKGNNLAMKKAKGEYILLLNPDTVVEEDTFYTVVKFMDEHPDAGGLGVRMLDGKGRFLPESKRGLPTPSVAFYKIFGLSKLFPKSRKFGRYHLGFLNEHETHEIEILSGAFMLMRKSVLDKIGLLDEAFFMYGEDIDLSYRIILDGYKNYYLPKTRIIHYKGESTKKSSVNYVFVFYRAMIIFAQKHFSQKNAKLFSFLINSAIYFRAGMAIVARFLKKALIPTIDVGIIVSMLLLWVNLWANNGTDFPERALQISIPIYTLIWLISNLYMGTYDKPSKFIHFVKGTVLGTALILIMYALLPKSWQFSRLFILVGAITILIYFILSRLLLSLFNKEYFALNSSKVKVFAIVGSQEESRRVEQLLQQTNQKIETVQFVASNDEKFNGAIGTISQLDQIVHIHKVDEVIFCAKDNTAASIIEWMSKINTNQKVDFKIAQPDSVYIIGSNSINTSGEMYMFDINSISKPQNKRNKRTFDFLISFLLLILSPISIWFYQNKKRFLSNMLAVLTSKKTIVGYAYQSDKNQLLPHLKPGILFPQDLDKINKASIDAVQKLNLIYARDYKLLRDVKIFQKAWKKLDR